MEDEHLLIIGGSYDQEPLVRKAKQLNYKTIVIDQDVLSPGYKTADIKKNISTKDVDGAIEIAKEFNIKGVVTNASESAVKTVAKVSQALSLPGIPVDVAQRVTDKELMKKAFETNGIPTASYRIVETCEDALLAAEYLAFPCIIKPVDGAGSRGVLRIDSKDEVKNAFCYSIGYSKKKRCIIEQFIAGIELSADAFSYGGKTEILAISDKEKIGDGRNNVAMNIVYPARFSEMEIQTAKKLIRKTIHAVGINEGPSHTEIIRRAENDFMVVETAARGGGFYTFSEIVPLACGVDTMEQLIHWAVGKPVKIMPLYSKGVVLKFMTAEPGRVVKLSGLKALKEMRGVIAAGFFIKTGDILNKLEKDGDRAGYMIICANSSEEAVQISERASCAICIETKPIAEKEG